MFYVIDMMTSQHRITTVANNCEFQTFKETVNTIIS